MWVDRKPFIYLWRPLYRVVITSCLVPLVCCLKRAAFEDEFREIRGELRALNARLDSLQTEKLLTSKLEAQMSARELESSRQWIGMETLILSVLSERVLREHRIE